MKMSEDRAAIPLGAMKELWDLHLDMLNLEDDAGHECARCGCEKATLENELIICDTQGCKRVQHRACSGIERGLPLPEHFWCSTCTARKELGMD